MLSRLSSCSLVLALVVAVGGSPVPALGARPDIVIFLCDDLGQRDSSPYGARDIRTPNMQRLADAGLVFDRAFVASPSCAPSRAALLTGLMPARNGAEANHSKPRAELKTWPAWFHDLGYEVVAFGKVGHYQYTADYGFDRFEHGKFHDHAAIPAAVEFLKTRPAAGARPLCLFVGSNWPHVPWPEADPADDPARISLPAGSVDTPDTRAWRARYATAVTRADDQLGLVYDAVRAHLRGDTLFLFSSDHGAQWPLGKWNCYEAGLRVPLIVAWPGVVRPGTHTDAMVSWVDLLPTLLEAAGGRAPADIDGRSFLPVLRGETEKHRDRIFAAHSGDGRWNVYPIRSVRDDRWKYIRNLHPEFAFTTHIDLPGELGQRGYFATWEAAAKHDAGASAILRRYHARPAEELYDLAADPDEQHNLANDPRHAARLDALRAELDAWMHAQGDRRTVFAEPRPLSDPRSYGPDAPPGNAPTPQRRDLDAGKKPGA
jgi:arylsulfatase A-like enzyme